MNNRILLLERLVNVVRAERDKPATPHSDEFERLRESARLLGRAEICNAVLDFIHREQEMERGNEDSFA